MRKGSKMTPEQRARRKASVTHRSPLGGSLRMGYVYVYEPDRPHTSQYVRRCRLIAEKALGKPLPKMARVHHINGIKTDDRNSNLVICENDKYHSLLHVRQKILACGGNPNTQAFCSKCKQLKLISDFWPIKKQRGFDSYCKRCRYERTQYWFKLRKAKLRAAL